MKIELVFDEWRDKGESIYDREEAVRLSEGDFHSGSMFDAEIELDEDTAAELQAALKDGFTPVFYVAREMDK